MNRTLSAAIRPGVLAACCLATLALTTPPAVRAAQFGPGLADLPAQPRPAADVEQDLAAIDAQLAAALALRAPESAGTPLGAPPPAAAAPRTGTALIGAAEPEAAGEQGLGRTLLALAGVVALILGLSWMFKRASRAAGGLTGSLGAGGRAPAGVVEVLARYPVAARHTLVVLRFDRRVLLCSMTGGSRSGGPAMTVLSELEDPEDVASVLIKSRDQAGETLARSFERSLREAERLVQDTAEPEPVLIRRPTPVRPVVQRTSPPRRNAQAERGGPQAAGVLRRGLATLRAGGEGR